MGNELGRCLCGEPAESSSDEGLGHSFCYVRPDSNALSSSSKVYHSEDSTAAPPPKFRSISGASVSANTATALSTAMPVDSERSAAAAFDCSTSFSSVPLQPIPRGQFYQSGPLSVDRGFMSGPIERGFLSGPLDNSSPKTSLLRRLKRPIIKTIVKGRKAVVAPMKAISASRESLEGAGGGGGGGEEKIERLQWAQGKAGEDRVHVVISEDQGWVFVGIYDGFNGPDAPDFLMCNLYSAVYDELEGLTWREEEEVLKKMELALRKTEEEYLEVAEERKGENPELALMGSCVLVMVMKGEDVYLMNVGDSRAVLGRDEGEEEGEEEEEEGVGRLAAVQLTLEHSTGVEEEIERIRGEHPDDHGAVFNDRVKGSLKVTRAFGAGFLKQPKWNEALLEVFRIDYVGSSPYLTCEPSLSHHRLGPRDRFLILSSDGLYQYFTNEEAVAEVELFFDTFPEGDPAQHLVEEVLFRAAAKAGMDFHQLLEIPQGDRRKYHDDVSVIVISLEGRIWRYSV